MTSDIRIKIGLDGVQQVQAGAQQAAQSLSRVGDAADLTSRQARLLTRNFGDALRALGGGDGALGAVANRVGQLGLAFGGLDGIAGRITPATVAIGGLAAAAGSLALAYKQGKDESDAYAKALILSGNAAGTTIGQLNQLAKAQAAVAGSQGKAAEVLTQLAASGQVASSELGKAAAAAIRFERAGGTAADETVKKFIELGKDPLKALIKFNEAENFLSLSVYKTVKALEEQGKKTEAATVAQNAYADAISGRSAQLEPRLGLLQKRWQDLGDAAAKAWNFMLNIGRESTIDEQLSQAANAVAAAQVKVATRRGAAPRTGLADVYGPQNALQNFQGLNAGAGYEALSAYYQKTNAANVKAAIAADQAPKVKATADAYGDLVRELAKLRQTQEEELASGGKVSEARKLQIRLIDQLADKAGKLTFEQRRSLAAEIALRVAAQEAIDLQAAELKSAQEIAAARIEARKREQQAIDDYLQKQREATEQNLKSVRDRAQGLEDEEQAAALAARSNISLAEAIEQVAIARLQERRGRLNDTAEGQAAAADIDREIAARQRLAAAIAGKSQRESAEKSAQELQQAYVRAYDQISSGLTDALIQGGKSAADYIKGLFRTMVLRPLLEPFVRPVAGVVAGLTGSSGALAGTGVGGGTASALDLFSAGKTLYEGFSSGFAAAGSQAASLYARVAESQLGARFGMSTLAEDAAGNIYLQQTAGSQATGGAFGTVASTAAGAAVGVYGGRAISGGYSAFGNSGNAAVNVGTVAGGVIGAIFGAPGVGAAIGGAIGGVVNRVFGRKAPEIESRAIEGTISGTNFTGSTVQNIVEKGGLFRSDKRYSQTQAITGDLDKALDEGAQQLSALAAKYGAALGLPAERLANVTADIKVAITDSAEDNAKAIADALKQYSDALLGSFADDVEPFRKSGETVAQTIERVGGSLLTVNDAFKLLGVQALATSIDGGKAALALSDAFGGAETFASAAGSFYSKFYSESERADRATQQLAKTLGEFGLAVPATRDAYRELVKEQLALGESGYPAAAALLGLADTFDALRTAAGDSAQALAEVIAQRKQLETQLFELQGNTAALRERERAALDESNRALYDQIKALEDQADAAKLAADAAEEAAKAAEDLANRQRAIAGGVDSVIGDFLSGGDLANYKAQRVQELLAEGGIESTVPGILGSTRADILRLWEAVGVDGREAILSAYGAWKDLQDILYGTQKAVDAYRKGSLADRIFDAGIASLSPADRIKQLRNSEAYLFGQIATADDPVAVAEQLTNVITRRISEEANLQKELGDLTLDNKRKELDAAKALRDVVAGIPQFTASLRFSDLSPLSPRQQVEEARKLFESTVVRAQGGDQVAISNLTSNAQAYISEANAAFGSDARAAGVFDTVTRTLDQFAASIGPALDPQIAALEAQVAAAETTAGNTTEMLAALLSIDAALGGRASSGSNATPSGTDITAEVGGAGGAGSTTSVTDQIVAGGIAASTAQLTAMATQLSAVAANTVPIAAGVAVAQEGYTQLIARLRALEAQQAQIVSQLNYATS